MLLDELVALVEPEPGANPTERDVETFQIESGYRLPTSLSTLLAKTGGGNLKRILVAEWANESFVGGKASLCIAQIFGFSLEPWRSIRPLSLHIEQMEVRCEGVPNGIYCIADDWGGNVVTIDLRDATYGNIGFVHHETVGDRFTDRETYELVAGSFEEFLTMLNPAEEDES